MFRDVIEGIAKKAEAASPREEGDYEKDGLLYCGKCHTQKQCRVQNPFVPGRIDIRSCICKCRQEAIEAAEEQARKYERERFIRDLRRIGFPDNEMQSWTFDRDDGANKRISTVMRRYVDKFPEMRKNGKGLLLYGPPGTGKTFAAACVANALIDNGYPCLMTNFARLSNTLMGMFDGKQAYIDGLTRFDLLVIDDLASERDTEYMGEIVQTIVDSRYRAGLPLVITTNLTGSELKNPVDMRKQRIYSRLFEMCVPIEVSGSDRRRKKLTDEYNSYAEMLGLNEGG